MSTPDLPRGWLERVFDASLTGSTAALWAILAECLLEVLPADVLVVWETFGATLYRRDNNGMLIVEQNSDATRALQSPQLYTSLNISFQSDIRHFDNRALLQAGIGKHPLLASSETAQACTIDFLQPDQQIGATIVLYGGVAQSRTRHEILERMRPTIERVYLSLLDRKRQVAAGIGLGEFLRELPVGLIMADWFRNVLVVNDEGYRHAALWNEGSVRASVKAARKRFMVAPEIIGGWEILQEAWIKRLRTDAPIPEQLVIFNERDSSLKATVSLIIGNDSQMATPCFMTRFSSIYTRSIDAVFDPTPHQISVLADLSPAERSVALLVRQGMSNLEIAKCLGREVTTIKDHLTNIYSKTGSRSRGHFVYLINSTSP